MDSGASRGGSGADQQRIVKVGRKECNCFVIVRAQKVAVIRQIKDDSGLLAESGVPTQIVTFDASGVFEAIAYILWSDGLRYDRGLALRVENRKC
jgi:hypothetical protein